MIFSAIGAIIGAVTTFIGTLGVVGTFALQMAAGIGVSYLAKALAGKSKATTQSTMGVQGALQASGDVPRSFVFGKAATAGSLVYANTWGNDGQTPNAYFTQVIALSDLPIKRLTGLWVNGEKCTIDYAPLATIESGDQNLRLAGVTAALMAGVKIWDFAGLSAFVTDYIGAHGGVATAGAVPQYGFPIKEYRKNNRDYLWVKFYDGTQTSADTFLVNQVSSADRPYENTRVGKGVAYAIFTSLVEDTLFTGFPSFLPELDGIALYDPSKDSTVTGGSGSQRFSDESTWGGDGDDLPAVQIYNLLRGISYNGTWLYGLQSLTARRLEPSNWIAQIAKCRADIEGEDGLEPAYRSGGQVAVDEQLGNAVEALLTTCQGRLAEIGGFYKIHLGAPDSTSFSFTDDDILSTAEQSFTPFFGLADTINGISAKYPSPDEGWQTKVAPPLYSSVLEIKAGNRRLMSDVALDFVPYSAQVQRLMKSALAAAQRARRHTIGMPPMFWLVEPGDIGSWTSARNGYVDKFFEVNGVVDKANLDVTLDLTEVDPSDYDWDHDADYVSPVDGTTTFPRPAPQGVVDWFAEGVILKDANGVNRRPAIRMVWDGSLPGVVGVQYEIRLALDGSDVARGRTDQLEAGAIIVSQSLLPDTAYQVRGQYLPSIPRDMLWSDWLGVTTPDVRFSIIDLDNTLHDLVTTQFADETEKIHKIVQVVAATVVQALSKSDADKRVLRSTIQANRDALTATIDDVRTVAVTANEAVAILDTAVTAQFGEQSAQIETNQTAVANIFGKLATQYTVTLDVNGYASGFKAFNDGSTSAFVISADVFQVAWPGMTGGEVVPVFQIANVNGHAKLSFRGDMFADGTVTLAKLDVGSLSALTVSSPDGKMVIDLANAQIVGYGS